MTINRQSSIVNCHWSLVIRRMLVLVLIAALLSGCLLVSGERSLTDPQPGAGSITASFVSAEGADVRELNTGTNDTPLNVVVLVAAEAGELRLELLTPDGAVAFATQSRPGERVTRTGSVRSNQTGVLRYRVVARNARGGSYEIFYQQP